MKNSKKGLKDLQKKKRNLTREKVILAAIQIANEFGFEEVTLKSVAQKCDVKPPSLFNHVENLEHIQSLLYKKAAETLGEKLLKLKTLGKTKESLLKVGLTYYSFFKESPGFYVALNRKHNREDKEIKEAADNILKLTAIKLGWEKSSVHDFRLLHAYLHGFIDLEGKRAFQMRPDPEKSFLLNLEKLYEIFK